MIVDRAFVLSLIASAGFMVSADQQVSPRWIAEQGVRAVQRGDAIELNGNRGWLRLNAVYSDFVLEFEFQLFSESSSAIVSIRSRPGYDRNRSPFYGYHLHLSDADDNGRLDVVGVTGIQSDGTFKPASRTVGEWQRARIEVKRRVLIITLNADSSLRFEQLDEFAGYVALRAARGRVAFRNMRLTPIQLPEHQFESRILRMPAPGVRPPKLLREVKPFYPKEPHDAWIEGHVELEAVVQEDGSVGDVRVTQSKHPDLAQAAVAAARRWRFQPAQKDGLVIPLIVTIDISFSRTP
jgi:TonB family protein